MNSFDNRAAIPIDRPMKPTGGFISLVALWLVLGSTAHGKQDSGSRTVLLLGLRGDDLDEGVLHAANETLSRELREFAGAKVMTQDEIEAVLTFQGLQLSLSCPDDECYEDIARGAKGDLILTGTLGRVGNAYLVALDLVAGETGSLIDRASAATFESSETGALAVRLAVGLLGAERVQISEQTQFRLARDPGETIELAVLDIEPGGLSRDLARSLTEVIALELRRLPGLSVISKDDIQRMLEFEGVRQQIGCGDDACLAEIGGALGVGFLVSGTIGKVGETYLISLKLINIQEARTENRVAESFTGPENQLLAAARAAGRDLVGERATGVGQLIIRPSVDEEIRLLVDGRAKMAAELDRLSAGRHNLRVEAEGYHPWVADLYVESQATTVVDPLLLALPEPWYRKWWLWTAVVTVLVAGVTTVAVVASQSPATGTLDVNAAPPLHGATP